MTEKALHNVNQFIRSIYNSLQRLASLLSSEMLDSYPKAILISCNIIYDTMILIDFFVAMVEIQQ